MHQHSSQSAAAAALPDLVTDQKRLDALCAAWRAAGLFAFDTEFIRDETYDAKLCLIQVAACDEVVLIDPLAEIDLSPFWALVTDPKIRTVVHAGKEDFDLCLRMTGKPPRGVFDIQIGAGFVGLGYPTSLSRLVQLVVHRRLSKGQTLTDWLRRPLTPEQLHYAVDDVLYLPQLYLHIEKQLRERGRTEWAAQEFARLEDAELYKPPIADRVTRIRGSAKLDGLSLYVLGKLLEWRDAWARERNRPIRALIRDDILLEIARRRPTRARELEVLRGFPQAKNAKIVGEIITIIEQAAGSSPKDWPQVTPPREETSMMRAVAELLGAFSRAACDDAQVDPDLVGGPSRFREFLDFVRGETTERPGLLSGWREEFIGRRLIELLEGRCTLQLRGGPKAPRLLASPSDPPPKKSRAEGTPRKPPRSSGG